MSYQQPQTPSEKKNDANINITGSGNTTSVQNTYVNLGKLSNVSKNKKLEDEKSKFLKTLWNKHWRLIAAFLLGIVVTVSIKDIDFMKGLLATLVGFFMVILERILINS